METEITRDAKDAERYRWLRERMFFQRGGYKTDDPAARNIIECHWNAQTVSGLFVTTEEDEPASLDAAIDRAMAVFDLLT